MPALLTPELVAVVPEALVRCVRLAETLLSPLIGLMNPGQASLPLVGRASNHGPAADRLESFSRPALLAAHWLAADDTVPRHFDRNEVATWFRAGLITGTDPSNPQYWGPTSNLHQHSVEMAALVLAMEIAPDWLWQPFSEVEKDQIAHWLGSIRGSALHRNNHLFFGVLPLCFLQRHGYGTEADAVCVERWLNLLESMAIGGGWFVDGSNESVDYYNAFAFHYYGPWWAMLYGDLAPERVDRWRGWTREFLCDYTHFFAATGEHVPFGRSLTYRFAASAPFALAAKSGDSPVPPGLARRLCMRNIEFFVPASRSQEGQALPLGWVDEFPALAEAYSCAGSPYWAAKGFAPLLLPAAHPFWTAPEELLPAEASDFSHPIPPIGMVLRADRGAVEMLNGGSAISGGNASFGAFKWGKLSYRSGIGFEIGDPGTGYPLDAALVAEAADGSLHGRRATESVSIEKDHLSCLYALGDPRQGVHVQVSSHLWWNGGWQFHLHICETHQPVRLLLGSYSLAAETPDRFSHDLDFPFAQADNSENAVALHALAGFQTADCQSTFDHQSPRTHLLAASSLGLVLRTAEFGGKTALAALSWTGPANGRVSPWKIQSSELGCIRLVNAENHVWEMRNAALTPITINTP